ncbi:conserved hypothetical protein [uncultured Desulfobacterium sp.]|uniref:Heavy-metal chelation domain-containing protein n=1 Tax=uncultured Desulfobacterium sp. TaxID=201089 RepID=A0A445MR33_9BACT|nr:conserved hypothetical protein [uncultured Desulfobacterium sp.]
MKILYDLISTLDFNAPVRDIRQGFFHTGVLTRYCGLASTLPKDALRQEGPLVRDPGHLLEKTSEDLVRMVFSDSILEAAIGMAAINSLLELDQDRCVELNAAELILEKGEGKNISVIGHFPFLPRVRQRAKNLWVIEKNPMEGDYPESDYERFIPQSDVVAITGTSLTNHTLEKLLGLSHPKAYIVLLGDTAPLSPVLFSYGINAVSGTRVVDHNMALWCVSQGANFRQIRGIRKLTLIKP